MQLALLSTDMAIVSALKQLAVISSATACIYFGFRLFYLTETAGGDFEASSRLGKVRLVKAAPGIFFTLFGCIVLVTALTQHSELTETGSSIVRQDHSSTQDVNAKFGVASSDHSSIDPRTCSRSIHLLLMEIRGNATYQIASGIAKSNYDAMLDGGEVVLAQCVDAAVAPGAYRVYKAVQSQIEKGGIANVDETHKRTHQAVARLFGE